MLTNTINSGSINIGSGDVLSNIIFNGGITAGAGSMLSHNSIENNPGLGIQSSGTITITQNRLLVMSLASNPMVDWCRQPGGKQRRGGDRGEWGYYCN